MKKKRIILTVTNDLTYDQRMIRICSSLAKADYFVTLVGRQRKNSRPLFEQPFQQKRLNCIFEKGKLFYLEYNFRLFIFLLFNRCDAICGIDLDTLLPVYFVSRLKGIKMIYDAHEYYIESPEIIRRPRIKSIWEWVGRTTVPKCKYCYTVGNGLAEIFEKQYGVPFHVIRNFPKRKVLTEPTITSNNEKRIIFYQGALNEGRGLEQMIQAMQQIEGAEFWLAGEGDLSEHLRELTTILELEKKVQFLGYVLPEELHALTVKAYLGVNLLNGESLNYYYSLANKALDYVQAGVPALNMNFPEYQQLHKEFEVSILLDQLLPDQIAATVNKLLGNTILYDQLKENCKKASAVWTWEEEEKKLFEFYEKVFREEN